MNPHGRYGPHGLKPCASANSAIPAGTRVAGFEPAMRESKSLALSLGYTLWVIEIGFYSRVLLGDLVSS